MTTWYDCLLLKNRTLTDFQMEILDRVDVTCGSNEGVGVMIGPKRISFARPMYIESTHHHHLNALLAMIACYVDPSMKSLYDYPARHVQFAAAQQVGHK